jgi:hypothetical protein
VAFISSSKKFGTNQKQEKITSGSYVLFRVVLRDGVYAVMTATAAEDDQTYAPYPDQQRLMREAVCIISEWPGIYKSDTFGRPYVEFVGMENLESIKAKANRVADALGLDPIVASWTLRDIWEEFHVGDYDEPAYLSDGMWVTSDGRLIEQ